MVVSDHYLRKYSRNPIQAWCVHKLGECSELIHFWATLAKFWSSNCHKMTENGGFQPSSEEVSTQSNSNLVYTFLGWVFQIDPLLGHDGQILALWWPNNNLNWWFPTVFWKSILTIQFKLGFYTCWSSVHIWSAFEPRWPNLGPLVATKWLKMVCFRPLSEKLLNLFQTWCSHLLKGSSKIIPYFCRICLI